MDLHRIKMFIGLLGYVTAKLLVITPKSLFLRVTICQTISSIFSLETLHNKEGKHSANLTHAFLF